MMIILVDDDVSVLEVSLFSLEEAGLEVRAFSEPMAALDYLESKVPDLIVSDIMMPVLDGFAFREAYLHSYPNRNTPFLFLSSVSDPDIIVEGLESGAMDYLIKPVDHRVFAAKVRSLLKKNMGEEQAFHGNLAQFPLSKVMKFCELKGLTGSVDIIGAGVDVTLACRGGQFELGRPADSGRFERAFDLTDGSFTIRIQPINFTDFRHEQSAASEGKVPVVPSQETPMGVLSGVKVNQRLFQVQSEYAEQPHQQILTLVILDGKVVLKRGLPAPLSLGRTVLQKLIEEQHAAVEKEIKEKINSLLEAKILAEPTLKERFNALFEEGWECYRQGEYGRSLTLWEEARELNPADKTIETNLKIVRKKLVSQEAG